MAPQYPLDESKSTVVQQSSQDGGSERGTGGGGDLESAVGFGGGGGRRRGIFNIPSLELPRLSPATINIQIPGKLPFNPLNIFNVQSLKNFVQSVTDKFMRNSNDQPYRTGFGDSVTIISEDPEKPVSENYGSSSSASSSNPSILHSNAGQFVSPHPNLKEDRLGVALSEMESIPQSQRQQSLPLSVDYHSSSTEPSSTDAHLTEESMIDRQVATLNEVLTNEMNYDKENKPTSPSPPRLSFLPDLSALSQLFNWGEHSVRSLAVCNACKVAFGLFVSQVCKFK